MPQSITFPTLQICLFLLFVTIFYKACSDTVNKEGCGRPAAKSRILNGKNVRRANQPWMVSVISVYAVNSSNVYTVYCGGTLVAGRFVLTAARCLYRNGSHASIVRVYYESEKLQGDMGRNKYIRAKDVILHPRYDYKLRKHNVALLRLWQKVERNTRSNRICLMEKKSRLVNKKVKVIGYGPLQGAQRLRYANDEIISFTNCLKSVPLPTNTSAFNNSTMICTAGRGKGSCQGDSGGPVVIEEDNRVTQVGLISYPLSCNSSSNLPSAHARIDYYFEWIKDVLAYFQKYQRQGRGNEPAPPPPPPPPKTTMKPVEPPKPQLPPPNGDVGHLPNYTDPQ